MYPNLIIIFILVLIYLFSIEALTSIELQQNQVVI